MLQGTRLDYIVPGYTGHISVVRKDQYCIIQKEKPRYQIPGYAGYVKSVKPQNIHAKTFGKITYNISEQNYIKGQQLPPQHMYVSSHADTFINPKNMNHRTAADIVGVENVKIKVKQPQLSPSKIKSPDTLDQFTLTRNWPKLQKKDPTGTHDQLIMKDGKPYLKLGQPLPGYTGFNRRVFAGNIFGQTYANSRKTAKKDQQKIQDNMRKTFTDMMISNPTIKP